MPFTDEHVRGVRPAYLPTPSQIEEACAAIRSAWTPSEANRRAVGNATFNDSEPWHPPRIDTSMCLARVRRSITDQLA